MNPTNTLDLIGQRFGKLIVLSRHLSQKKHSYWLCKCDCGKERIICGSSLKYNATKSCGCLTKRVGENHPRFTGYKGISGRKWIEIKKCAKVRNLEMNITLPYLWNLFLKQKRLCALTHIPITLTIRQDDRSGTASLDRIDSSRGYVKGNVQWVHKDINKMKTDFDQSIFIKLCKSVANRFSEGQAVTAL